MLTLQRRSNIKKLKRLVKKAKFDVWFEDECHFQQHGSRCAMWVPPEDKDPVIMHASTRKKVGVFGAVCVGDGRLVTQQDIQFDASSFQTFLTRLVRHRKRSHKMIIIVDNARWHHAKQIKPWLKRHRDIIQLDFLPPYSPNHYCPAIEWPIFYKFIKLMVL